MTQNVISSNSSTHKNVPGQPWLLPHDPIEFLVFENPTGAPKHTLQFSSPLLDANLVLILSTLNREVFFFSSVLKVLKMNTNHSNLRTSFACFDGAMFEQKHFFIFFSFLIPERKTTRREHEEYHWQPLFSNSLA